MSFQIYKISIDGKEYELSRDIGDRKNIISVMTGKNGTGKSRILEFIATNFIISDSFLREYPQNWGPRFNELIGNYESNQITYTSSGHLIKAQRLHQDMACAFLSENYIENRFNVFPHRLVCLSTSPFDRFPVDTTRKIFNIEDSIYSYIGMKNNQRKISITSLISNVIDTMFKRTERLNVNFSVIKKTLDYLDYGNRLLISYKSNVTIDDISILTFDYISNLLLSLEYEINVNEKSEEWNSIVEDIHVSIHILYDRYNSKWKKTFSIPLNFSKDDVLESDYIKSIQILSRYGLLCISTLKLSQKNDNRKFVNFSDASSGEQCLALMLLGIASQIEDHSLICIDEPEISLHPEWQEDFIPLINELFDTYFGCHFIIATHSPLIISRLDPENCFVLDLDSGNLNTVDNSSNSSSDYQLATLFKSPGFKNEYLINESLDMLNILSRNIPIDTIFIKRVSKLLSLQEEIDKEDPVYSLMTTINKVMETLDYDQ